MTALDGRATDAVGESDGWSDASAASRNVTIALGSDRAKAATRPAVAVAEFDADSDAGNGHGQLVSASAATPAGDGTDAGRGRLVPARRLSTIQLVAVVALLVLAAGTFAFLKWLLAGDAARSPLVASYGALVTAYLVSRAYVGARQGRRAALPSDRPRVLPSVAVIVPVKNEGLMVGSTISRLFANGYPADRFEVVVIDDGSTDETTSILRLAQIRYSSLRVITLPRNLGKRKAMAAGIRATSSDVVVVIDSDTLIAPGAIEKLVQTFADQRVAAAAGRTEILNEDTNALTRVQALIYEISFRIHKSAETAFGSVTCCPGCFSAYRREAIAPLLDEWSSQRFLDDETIFGDDRALTMLLLRERWDVRYEPSAVAHTDAPTTLRGYLRQQLRWKKSWIQQGIRAMRFMWRRPPLAALWFYVGFVLSLIAPHVLLRAMVIGPIVHHAVPIRFLAGLGCVGAVAACYLCLLRGDLKRLRAMPLLPVVGMVLTLQMPFAIARLADARWGTR